MLLLEYPEIDDKDKQLELIDPTSKTMDESCWY